MAEDARVASGLRGLHEVAPSCSQARTESVGLAFSFSIEIAANGTSAPEVRLVNRRDAVQAILLVSGSVLGGCCTVETLPPIIGGDIPPDLPLILKPARIAKAS